jgi:hypothetical protein
MKKIIALCALLLIIHALSVRGEDGKDTQNGVWNYSDSICQLDWNWQTDQARMFLSATGTTCWNGGLLPAFWIEARDKQRYYLKTEAVSLTEWDGNGTKVMLRVPGWADGTLVIRKNDWGIQFSELSIRWEKEIPRIIEMYWGTRAVEAGKQSLSIDEQQVFTPDWSAAGYCIPAAKAGPVQSFFRHWDLGHSNMALGNFGMSMSAPYGGAFPRPILFFAMGNNSGWINFGVGDIPDAAMSLKFQPGLANIKYSYREDLWGASVENKRTWNNPLKITFGKTAYDAFVHYYSSFPVKTENPPAPKAVWNTWGNWRERKFPVKPMVDFTRKLGVEVFVVDDPWQVKNGGVEYNKKLFPDFENDLNYIRENRMTCGYWETLGWIGDTIACGLTKNDLILDRNGNPCLSNWPYNSLSGGSFFIDLSSENAREYIKKRTAAEMKLFHPSLIKLDFGYAMPGPQTGVPRDPALRGERHTFEMIKLISRTAKETDPNVSILYYGIHPSFAEFIDYVSLDDQDDMWFAFKEGHDQWTVWASLLSGHNVVITGSSCYDWHKDAEVILNTFLLGSPSAVLATQMPDGAPVPDRYLNRRLAVNKWFRRSVRWQPLWLNSHLGNLSEFPKLNCCGRLENGKLTTLILRGNKVSGYETLEPFEWAGRWAIVAQDDRAISESATVAIVPFDAGHISMTTRTKPRSVRSVGLTGEQEAQGWTWNNGQLKISISENQLNDIAGFLVNYK